MKQQAEAERKRDQAVPERREIMRFKCGDLNENWYVAALSKEVTGKRPTASTILEEPLVLFRAAGGQPVAMLDRCLHRNAALSAGQIFDGCIGCPYHGWTYNAEGRCVFVPSEGPKSGGTQAEAPAGRPDRFVESFPARDQDGLVWVYMGAPERAAECEPFRFPPVGPGWMSYTMVTDFAGDVTDLVENFMDVPHTSFVHGGWFRKTGKPKRGEAQVERTNSSVLVDYVIPGDSIGFTSRLLNPDNRPMTHTDKFFMPNCTRVDYAWGSRRAFVITSEVTPITPVKARVYTAITFQFGPLNWLARIGLPWYTRVVINQDVRIMAVQTANLRRFGSRRFNGTGADIIHRHIEALRDYALAGEHGDAPAPTSDHIAYWI
jgi:phenylpropionate dioxygenase-like ring-hydroxylating dioxygenase large terminal subunit